MRNTTRDELQNLPLSAEGLVGVFTLVPHNGTVFKWAQSKAGLRSIWFHINKDGVHDCGIWET